MVTVVIETKSLTKRYGSRLGVASLSIGVAEGSIYGFLGPNGSGKTTTIRVLMGLMKASEGAARVFDRDCWASSAEIKEDVGYLPGDIRLYPWLTCHSAARIFGAARRRTLREAFVECAERFYLDPDLPVRKMSRGTRQKLGLVLALAHKPRLLILDEPTASLDPIIQRLLYDHLRLAAAEGRTVFLSSHTLSEVEELCDRVAILRQGRLVAQDTIENLRRRASRLVAIHWQDGVDGTAMQPPAGLALSEKGRSVWTGTETGSSAELLAWLAGKPVADLILEKPDLSEVFHRFYREDD
jgi:ABC-2 type transport system ATP-binding protein